MNKELKLDIRNMIADVENDRMHVSDLINYLKEITAE
jgi:hypothetical protein